MVKHVLCLSLPSLAQRKYQVFSLDVVTHSKFGFHSIIIYSCQSTLLPHSLCIHSTIISLLFAISIPSTLNPLSILFIQVFDFSKHKIWKQLCSLCKLLSNILVLIHCFILMVFTWFSTQLSLPLLKLLIWNEKEKTRQTKKKSCTIPSSIARADQTRKGARQGNGCRLWEGINKFTARWTNLAKWTSRLEDIRTKNLALLRKQATSRLQGE